MDLGYQKFLFFDCVSCCLGQGELGKLIQGTFEFIEIRSTTKKKKEPRKSLKREGSMILCRLR